MGDVSSRELRDKTGSVLKRVEAGESVTITVDGRPVTVIEPLDRRSQWIPRADFLHRFATHQADSGLATDLAGLSPDTTDDLS